MYILICINNGRDKIQMCHQMNNTILREERERERNSQLVTNSIRDERKNKRSHLMSLRKKNIDGIKCR